MTQLEAQPGEAELTAEELATLMAAHQAATERLRNAHEQLKQEVSRLREELAAKNAELARKERLAALGQMAAGIAHEIRNPLGAIRLCVGMLRRQIEALLRDLPPTSPPKSHLQRMLQQTEKISRAVTGMDEIVEGMLSLARRRKPNLAPCDLNDILDRTLESADEMLRERGIEVVRRTRCDGRLLADFGQLTRALLNIVANAAQAMEGGGRLTIEAHRETDHLVLKFTDTGPGIEPNCLERIFEPFFTTREGGTGLGLALAHRIVEDHRGRLSARNEPEGGASFIVELPCERGDRR